MRNMKFLALLLGILAFFPAISRADFNQVCRGGSLYKYDNEIKKAVKAKLKAADVKFKFVNVVYTQIARPHGTYVNDFSSDLTVNSGDHPSVSFSGAFPNLATCTLSFNLKITVAYADGTKSVTITPVTAPGVLLPPLGAKRSNKDE